MTTLSMPSKGSRNWQITCAANDCLDRWRFPVDAVSAGRHFKSEQGLVTVGPTDAANAEEL
jgi:hypothetical protein